MMNVMKNTNQNKYDLDLELQEVGEVQTIDKQTLAELELIMTNSAFGFEYALNALDEGEAFGLESEKLRQEVENYRRVYFDARKKLERLDSTQLSQIEKDLHLQKLLVFSKQNYLH